ncbi:FAD-dependent monooxygenase [Mycobacterium sp. IEC1808]|uniref:FAD-dependent monooxygenase n=1 Tax=Mycobacterium sp. IEC1808 TaxID=1743230 RepID=UPI000A152A51|nr:NAD(P)/FAD-dependent oxidoreductase [Mycobacterium sp. IEC1808]ORW96737.1 FAD-dependent monooxygenase [Mycobacterium sp. IEC1808]
MSTPNVLIAGAGIGGLTAAIALRAKGIGVEICEAATELPASGTGLGLANNATKVLRALGIDLGLGASGQAIERFEIHTARGRLIRALPIQSVSVELGDPIVGIHRGDLMRVLLDAAGDTPIRFGAGIVDFEVADSGVRAICADGREARADVLIGADGIRSTIRSKIAGDVPPTDCGYLFWLATVPFAHERVIPGYAGHYWGTGQRFGLIDIGGGRVYWWGSKNMPVAQARSWRDRKTGILAAFDGWAREIIDVIEQTPDHTIVTVPAQDRPFLEQWGSGPVSLLGDAAHPMQTSMSQGASSAVEDAYVLAQAIARVPDPVAALRKYEDMRRKRTRMLVRNSRRLSKLEQVHNPVVRTARDLGLRYVPSPILRWQNIRPMRFDLAWDAR